MESMFKLTPGPNDSIPAPATKMKKPDQEPLMPRNNLKQTSVHHSSSSSELCWSFPSRTKKEYVENVVKTAFDAPSPPPQYQSSNTDILDRQLFEKADLDYIPGLDYDMGPVFIPSKILILVSSRLVERKRCRS